MSENKLLEEFENFTKNKDIENEGWYKSLKEACEFMQEVKKEVVENKEIKNVEEFNKVLTKVSENRISKILNLNDFIEKYIFSDTGEISRLSRGLVTNEVRNIIREEKEKTLDYLLKLLRERDLGKQWSIAYSLINERKEGNNCYAVLHRLLTAISPSKITTINTESKINSLLKKIKNHYEVSRPRDIKGFVEKNKWLMERLDKSNEDFYKKHIFYWELCCNNINLMEKGEKENMDKVEKENSNLNRVLYGPPGTGKTYNTINEALKILDRGFYEENILDKNREALKDKFEEYKENGQIEMITFHQNYGYEDFIEGIKAGTNENNDIVYSVEDGILKKMVKRSKPKEANVSSINFDWEKDNIFKMSLGGKNDESILEWCLENDYISMGWGESVDFSEIKGEKFEFFREKSKKKIEGKINEVDKKFTIQAMYAFRQWMKKDDLVFVSVGNLKIVAIAQVIGEYEFKEGTKEIEYSHYRKVKWLFVNREGILREDLLSKKISQQTIYNLKKDYVKKEYFDSLFEREKIIKPYVLIIDEINRGNISKIFGELITLIEDNKRLGNEEALEVTLPYSKEKFGIPNNLHILGTMNTADKSIALMDTALRRRFEFIEMMPDIEKLRDIKVGDTNIDLAKFLETINKRIEFLYDREHTIGHAYFMEIKTKEDLDNVMRNKIIPLLQEYFYEDWEKVQIVLGDYKKQNKAFKFVEAIDLKELDVLGFDYEETEDNVVSYKVNDKFDEIAYKIYED